MTEQITPSAITIGSIDPTKEGQIVPREAYHLSPERMDQVETDIVNRTLELSALTSGIVALVVESDSDLASFGRTSETNAFADEGYDFHAGMASYEAHSEFVYTVDLDVGKVAHVKRIVGPKTPEEVAETGLTGIEVIDDRLKTSDPTEAASLADIMQFNDIEKLEQCINISTNLNTKRGVHNFLEKPYSLISYKAIFEIIKARQIDRLFAYMNQKALSSLMGGLGISYELVNGKEYHLPTTGEAQVKDEDYVAVCIPATPTNQEAFTKVNPEFLGTNLIAEREVQVLFNSTK